MCPPSRSCGRTCRPCRHQCRDFTSIARSGVPSSLPTIMRVYIYVPVNVSIASNGPFLFSNPSAWYPRQCFHTAVLPPELIFAATRKAKQNTFLYWRQNFASGYLWRGLRTPFLLWWLPIHDIWQVLHRTNSLANALSAKWNIGLYLISTRGRLNI